MMPAPAAREGVIEDSGSWRPGGRPQGRKNAAYATLLAAKLANRSMTVFYNDNGFACGSLPQ